MLNGLLSNGLLNSGILNGIFPSGNNGPKITFSTGSILASVLENASVGDAIGNMQVLNGEGSYTFSITTDTDSKFQIDATDNTLLEVAGALDFETKTSHTVTISADNGVDTPITGNLIMSVTNIAEQTFQTLTLSSATIAENSAQGTVVGAIQGGLSGSTFSLIDDAGGRFQVNGSNIEVGSTGLDFETATSHDIDIRESNVDGIGGTNDTIGITITVTNEVDVIPAISGVPTITGTANVGQVLTATPASVTGDAPITRTWQWERSGIPISGATSSTYTLVVADYDETISVVQTETNDAGSDSAESLATSAVTGLPSAFAIGDWSIAAGDTQATVTISSLPTSDPAITDIEYRVDSGSWVSSGVSTTTTFDITGLTNGVQITVELRAVNALGNGVDSDDKTVTPAASASGSFLATDWSNIGFHLEATDSNSYGGTGQEWVDLLSATDKFIFGQTLAFDGSDPTFIGTAGTSSGAMQVDGGDFFDAENNITLLDNLHKKDTGKGFTLLWAGKFPLSNPRPFATAFTGTGMYIEPQSAGRINIRMNGSFIHPNLSSAFVFGDDVLFILTMNAARDESTIYVNGQSLTRTGITYTTNNGAPDEPGTIGRIPTTNNTGGNGMIVRSFAVSDDEITSSQAAALKTSLESRHGVTYA